MATANVAGQTLYYERRGSGEPLVLIMGMSGNTEHWSEPYLEHLERHFELLMFDNRGIGQSPPVDADFTIADMAGDTAALMDALGIDRAHVMGISMGGMIAQELAIGHGERVRGLVLGCTYPGGEGARLADHTVIQKLTTPMMSGDRAAAIRAGWEVNVSPGFAADDAQWKRFEEIAAHHPAPLEMIMRQTQAIGRHDTSTRLASIDAPTLVIHGTEDELLPVLNAELLADRIPTARLELLDDVGHLFFWERPEEVATLVREFLAGVDAPATTTS